MAGLGLQGPIGWMWQGLLSTLFGLLFFANVWDRKPPHLSPSRMSGASENGTVHLPSALRPC